MRLDRFVSHAAGLSRAQAVEAIRAGEVSVDGAVCREAGAHVAAGRVVALRGAPLTARGGVYLMLNKPPGYVCATRDERHDTVLELVNVPGARDLHICRASLHIAGRLDLDATGLVLITNDGEWSHRVMSPRHAHPKSYRVTLAEPLGAESAARLRAGVLLHGEIRPCAPAALEPLGERDWRIVITEGKYHQVKRMFAAVGNHVQHLHRERIGAVTLDAALAPGESRPLTEEEIDSFRGA